MTTSAKRYQVSRICANGVMLNWCQKGKGPDIVTVHGLAANLAFWYLNIIPSLSREFRITAFDLRGHGNSEMPRSGYTSREMAHDLRDLLDRLNISSAHLVGHSFGGVVALHCAALFPERVRTITVADARIRALQPHQKLSTWPLWERWLSSLDGLDLNLDGDQEMDFTLLETLARRALRNPIRAVGDSTMFLPFSGWNAGARNAEVWLRLLDTTNAREEFGSAEGLTVEALRTLPHPTLAIYGEYSFCLASCHGLRECLPSCEVKIVSEAGHYHPIIRSALFAETVRTFIHARSAPANDTRPHLYA